MEPTFWLKLLASFVAGSLWVTLTTISAERFGSKVGGLIGGFPSTVVIALLFVGLTQSAQVASQATTVMPLAQGLNGLFILTFILLIQRGVFSAIVGSLLVWFSQSAVLYWLNIQAFWISIVGWIALLALCYYLVEKRLRLPSYGNLKVSYPPIQLVWRALFGGSVISLAVLMGKVGGPLLGGIFGSFPAMFLSTLVISNHIGWADFSRSVGKSLLISGLVNVPIYEIVVRVLYPALGLGIGTMLALLVSGCTGYLTYLFMKSKLV